MPQPSDMAYLREQHEKRRRIDFLDRLSKQTQPYASLTSRPEWNTYLGQLKEWLDLAKHEQDVAAMTLADPMLVNTEKIMQAKLALEYARGKALAWQAAMDLPGQFLKEREEAEQLIRDTAGPA